jgi:hypothetical protein
MRWDVFLSHASEDKPFVGRLARELMNSGLTVWYDDFALDVGDSLRRSIDIGLRDSRYGIVVLSPHFFRKEWPQRELDGLTAREDGRSKVLLPIWYNVSAEEVRNFSPPLADKLSVFHAGSLKGTATKLLRSIHRDQIRETGWLPQQVALRDGIPGIVLPTRPHDGKALCIGKFPITNELYKEFIKATKHREPIGEDFINERWSGPFSPWTSTAYSDPNKPVVCIDFWDAVQFCEWASSKRATLFLPSAEIWEYAATCGHTNPSIRSALNFTDDCALHHKAKSPDLINLDATRDNLLGISDLFGNVWEWCGANRHEQDLQFTPLIAPMRFRRIEAELRGGGFLDDLRVIHPELRSGILENGTNTRHTDLGFRVCGTVSLKTLPAGLAAVLKTMPGLPESVWELARAPQYHYEEARYVERERRLRRGRR